MASSDARADPLKNATWKVTFPILDNDGDLVTGAAGLDSEVSKDGGNWTDCTNEASEINGGGIYTLTLTDSEMNADTVAIKVKSSTSDSKDTVLIVYPEPAGGLREIEDFASDIASDLVVVDQDTSDIKSKIDSDALLADADHDKTQSDVAALSGKQDSDMVVLAAQADSVEKILSDQFVKVYSDTTGVATAITNLTNTVNAVYSDTTVIESDTTAIEGAGGALTSAQDAALTQIASDTAVIEEDTASDLQTLITTAESDIKSNVASQLTVMESDIKSDATVQHAKTTSDVRSDGVVRESDLKSWMTIMESDIKSDATVQHAKTTSDLRSDHDAGVVLAAAGLDSITTTEPDGTADNFREMVQLVYLRLFGKVEQTSTSLILRQTADGSTAVTTQTLSESGGTATQGVAS